MGFILFIIAYVLFLPLSIVNFILVLCKKGWKQAKGYFRDSAISLDRYGNRELRTLWNAALRKSDGPEFGDINETISSVLGKNQRDGTLTRSGRALAWILDTLDKDHCKNAIGF